MCTYRPAEHSQTTSVAPLLHFFELVHIGDMIQSMVQVFFDKEMAPHIDRTDFLNTVMREKKRFENTLDDSVAAGLNAGTEVLMNQVGLLGIYELVLIGTLIGGAYHLDADGSEGVLSPGRSADGFGRYEGVYGGDSLFGYALQVVEGEYE
jgi:hypothetical protein